MMLLNVGRLANEKNLKTLLEAFSRARAACETPLRLALVGDGPQEQALQQKALAVLQDPLRAEMSSVLVRSALEFDVNP